jgi:hypothetical protein
MNVINPYAYAAPVSASDDFDSYANNTTMAGGGMPNWTVITGGFTVSKAASDGSLYATGATANVAAISGSFGENQRAEITFEARASDGGATEYLGIGVRVQSGYTGYFVHVNDLGYIYVAKANSGTETDLVADETPNVVSAGNRVAIEVTGSGSATRIRVQIDTGSGWVDKWTNQDPGATYISGGAPGVYGYRSSTSVRLDGFVGQSI